MKRPLFAFAMVAAMAAIVVAQVGSPPPTIGGNGGIHNTSVGGGPADGLNKFLAAPGTITYSVTGAIPNTGVMMVGSIDPCDVPHACGPANEPTVGAIDCVNFFIFVDGINPLYANPFTMTNGAGDWSIGLALAAPLPSPNDTINTQVGWFDPSKINGVAITNRCQVYTGATSMITHNVDDTPNGPIDLIGDPFTYYGISHTQIFLNPNGSLSFNTGDGDFTPTVAEFLTLMPKIAGCFYDLSPNQAGGNLTLTQTRNTCGDTTIAAVWTNVSSFGQADSNNLSITLDTATGSITYTYGVMTLAACGAGTAGLAIVGVSPGGGVPDPGEINISNTPFFSGAPGAAIYEQFTCGPASDFDLDNCAPVVTFTPNVGGYDMTATPGLLQLNSVTPSSGFDICLPAVTLRGCQFDPLATVDFSGTPVAAVVNNADEIVAMPAGLLPGVYDVTVTNPGPVTSTLFAAFTVNTLTYPIAGNITPLSDDGFVTYTFACGNAFTFYGTAHTQVRVCMNGRLMFGGTVGATDFSESTADLRTQSATVNFLWDDLSPENNGATVTFTETATDFTVSFNGAPEFTTTGSNTASATINFATGEITIATGTCSLSDALVGISPGNSLYPLQSGTTPTNPEIDLSATAMFTAPDVFKPIYEIFGTATTGSTVVPLTGAHDLDGLTIGFTPALGMTGPYTYHNP